MERTEKGPWIRSPPPLSFRWTEAIRGPAPQELSWGLSINPHSESPWPQSDPASCIRSVLRKLWSPSLFICLPWPLLPQEMENSQHHEGPSQHCGSNEEIALRASLPSCPRRVCEKGECCRRRVQTPSEELPPGPNPPSWGLGRVLESKLFLSWRLSAPP